MRLPRNFNPLHREGGDLLTVHYLPLTAISIHSTARVETYKTIAHIADCGFQSTPPRGWRRKQDGSSFCCPKFQSTPPRGWRPVYTPDAKWTTTISIHSTARVETNPPRAHHCYRYDFNPLHREGGDHAPGGKGYGHPISIHSTARVETRAAALPVIHAYDFNPLHREGGDYTQ